ncbi:hypothetical protein [Nocardioides aquiterrae]|uniref:Uncharacterized protein n=1 Tax=Nocardioides aquiterrae TaxID=203799 RepID=A0ABN1UP50_9ACTN
MTEDPEFPGPVENPAEPDTVPPEPERVRTGIAGVDGVIVAVEELEERPIEEHVGVFEAAQDRLRRALDATDLGDDSGDDPGADRA